MEAVKQGSCAVGLTSDTHVVLATLKRPESELSSHQRKVFKIDDHLGIAIAGLTADGRILCRYMRNECLNYRFMLESAMPVSRLVRQVADKHQICTQRMSKRPYGVGLLVAGYDATGAHLFNTCPSGNLYEYKAMAIGARAQAAKTYLEKKFDTFPSATLDELVKHGLKALAGSLSDGKLTAANTAVSVVGKGTPFTILEDDGIAPFIASLEEEEGSMAVEAPPDAQQEVADAAQGAVAPGEAAPNLEAQDGTVEDVDDGPAPMEI